MTPSEFHALLSSKGLKGEAGLGFLRAPDDQIRAMVDRTAEKLNEAVGAPTPSLALTRAP